MKSIEKQQLQIKKTGSWGPNCDSIEIQVHVIILSAGAQMEYLMDLAINLNGGQP